MALRFNPVTTEADIEHLAAMAADIWGEYWPPIIGQDQTDYMVRLFQSPEAIARDMRDAGYRSWIIVDEDGREVGYTTCATEEGTSINHSAEAAKRWQRRLFISKVYLYADERGKHYASRIIEFYEELCRNEATPAMYLTVNRDNELGVRAYKGRGFEVIEKADNPIGEGFAMTDYIMAKEVSPA